MKPAAGQARRWARPLPLGRVWGFPLYLRPMWLLLAPILTIGYGHLVVQAGALPARYALAAAFALGLAGSVLLHELGHAVACRHFGIGVRAVTLDLFGGDTETDRDPPGPRVAAAVALAGPVVSFGLGLLTATIAVLVPGRTVGHELAFQLAVGNLVIAVFNSLPGLPLDGGRVLLGMLWAATGDQYRASRIAGWTGRALALGCLVTAAVLAVPGGRALFAAAATALAGVTVAQGAGEAIRRGRLGGRAEIRAADPRGEHLVASGEDVVGGPRGADVENPLASKETRT